MYSIYIKNFLQPNGTPSYEEILLYSIPISDSDADSGHVLIDPVVKNEMGKTGTLEFGMNPDHSYYNRLMQMKTIMRVDYDGTCLFRGRVLTIDTSPLTGERKVHLEGDLAFLMDSIQPGVKEEERPEVTVLAYIQSLLHEHNSQMAEENSNDKKIFPGELPGQYSASIDDTQKIVVNENLNFGSSSWGNTMSALEALTKEYGGYFRTRYANGTCYLDWLDNCFNYTENPQPIEIGENLIDISGTTEVENIFTALIPIGRSQGDDIYIEGYREDVHGHNKRILVPQIVGLFSDAELNKGPHSKSDYQNAVNNYGIIYKTQSFGNADTQEKLWGYAIDWIKNNYVGGITSFDISALDMHHINSQIAKYLYGDRVRIIYPDMSRHTDGNTPRIQKVLTVMHAQYYLHNPEKNNYGIGLPTLLLSKNYGKNKTTGSGGKGGASGGIGGGNNQDDERYLQLKREIEEIQQLAWDYVANARYNGDIYDQLTAEDPKKGNAALVSTYLMVQEGLLAGDDRPTSGVHKKRLQKMWIDGVDGKLEMAGPVDPTLRLTDDQINQLNQVNRVISFDAVNQEFGMRQALEITAGSFPDKTPSDKLLMKVGLVKSSSGSLVRPQGSIELWNEYKDQFGSAKPSLSLFGDGTLNNIKQNIGKGTPGADPSDETTIKMDGSTALTQLLNPSTVGIPGVTPELTLEEDGANGALAAGAGGDLGGWKITLNKPLTYKATIDGTQKTFTVKAGQVAADDMHFTKRYDSVYAELAVFDRMYADYAQIGTLVAMKAEIDQITTDWVIAAVGDIDVLHVKALGASMGISTSKGVTAVGVIKSQTDVYIDEVSLGQSIYNIRLKDNEDGSYTIQKMTVSGDKWADVDSFSYAPALKGIKSLASSSSDDGTITLTPTLLDGTTGTAVSFSIAATLSGVYGGDNQGDTATYTVTGSPSKNFPGGNTVKGTFTLKISKQAAYVQDPSGAIRARVDNTYAGDEDAAYKRGWNDCIDSCSGGYYLDDYETYMDGAKIGLYVAPTGGAQKATGEDQVWRYGGTRAYRYTIPNKKE